MFASYLLSVKPLIATKIAMFASYLLSVKPLAVATPQPSVTKAPVTKVNPAPPPPARPTLRLRTPNSPPHRRPQAAKKIIVAAVEEDEEEEEPESSNYRVTPKEPQAAAARLQIPPKPS
jgi:hypothetical protein